MHRLKDKIKSAASAIKKFVGKYSSPITKKTSKKSKPRSKLRAAIFFSLKWTILSSGCLFFLLTTLLVISSYIFDETDVNRNLSKLLRDSTGAGINIDYTDFNLAHGITFRDISIYPLDLLHAKNQQPLLTIDELSIKWNIFRALIGQIGITEALIINPKIYLTNQNSVWNFQPILSFMEKTASHSSIQAPTKKDQDNTQNKPTLLISDILPIHPSYILILPFKLLIDNIGFKNFSADIMTIGATTTELLEIKGITATSHLEWLGSTSEIGVKIKTDSSNPFKFSQKIRTKGSQDFKTITDIAINIDQKIALQDLSEFLIKTDLEVLYFKKKNRIIKNLPIKIDILISLLESLDGFKMTRTDINILDVLTLNTKGSLGLLNKKLDEFTTDLDIAAQLNLDKAKGLIKQLDIPINASGKIEVESLLIKGPIIPDLLHSDISNKALPALDLKLVIDNVSTSLLNNKFTIKPITGFLDLTTIPEKDTSSFKVDVNSDIEIKSINIITKQNNNIISTNLKNARNTIAGQFTFPSLVTPFSRIVTEVESIKMQIDNQKPITFPLVSEIYGSMGHDRKKINLDAKVDILDLLELDLDIRCKDGCNNIKANTGLSIPDIERLFTISKPIMYKFVPLPFIPTEIKGKIDFQSKIRATSPNIKETNPAKVLKKTKGKIVTSLAVEGVSLSIPFKDFNLTDFDTQISLSGDLKNQRLKLNQAFKALTAKLDGISTISLKHYAFDTEIFNNNIGSPNLNNLYDKMKTKFESSLFVSEMHLAAILPVPLKGISFETKATQSSLNRIDLEKLQLKIPDLGTRIDITGSTHIKDFLPYAASIETNIELNGVPGTNLTKGINTQGKALVQTQINTDDLKKFNIRGNANFKNFAISMPDTKENAPPKFELKGMNGDLPLTQTINLSSFLANSDTQNQPVPTNSPPPPEASKDAPQIDALDTYFAKAIKSQKTQTNLVGHVDYNSVKDFYPESKTLTIEQVSFANLNLEKLEFDIAIKQGLFSLSQFVMSFIGGKIQGDMNVSFSPLPQDLKLSIHLTRLNTHKLLKNFPKLKAKTGKWDLFSNPYIDANIHINLDLITNDLAGGIDITTIGQEQLKMMLYYMDPEGKNPSITSVRSYLSWGNLSKVTIPIKNGMIGLDIQLSVLAIPMPLPKMTNFPITQLISNIISEDEGEVAESATKI